MGDEQKQAEERQRLIDLAKRYRLGGPNGTEATIDDLLADKETPEEARAAELAKRYRLDRFKQSGGK